METATSSTSICAPSVRIVGVDALDLAAEVAQQVDVVNALVGEGPPVLSEGAAPRREIVVALRAAPPDTNGHDPDAAELPALDRPLDAYNGAVVTILEDREDVQSELVGQGEGLA